MTELLLSSAFNMNGFQYKRMLFFYYLTSLIKLYHQSKCIFGLCPSAGIQKPNIYIYIDKELKTPKRPKYNRRTTNLNKHAHTKQNQNTQMAIRRGRKQPDFETSCVVLLSFVYSDFVFCVCVCSGLLFCGCILVFLCFVFCMCVFVQVCCSVVRILVFLGFLVLCLYFFFVLEHQTMDKVQKHTPINVNTPSSETYKTINYIRFRRYRENLRFPFGFSDSPHFGSSLNLHSNFQC
jgi:hypothetical protein